MEGSDAEFSDDGLLDDEVVEGACFDCGGTGEVDGEVCETCGGTGEVVEDAEE